MILFTKKIIKGEGIIDPKNAKVKLVIYFKFNDIPKGIAPFNSKYGSIAKTITASSLGKYISIIWANESNINIFSLSLEFFKLYHIKINFL